MERLQAAAAHHGIPLVVLENRARWASQGLNQCVLEATGELLVRLDCHSRYPSDYLRRCAEVAEAEPDAAVVSGIVVPQGRTSKARRRGGQTRGAAFPRGGRRRPLRWTRRGRAFRSGRSTRGRSPSPNVRQKRVDRLLDDEPDADRGREVVDDVALVHKLTDHRGREHRLDDEVEARVLTEMGDVLERPGRDVVERVDLQPSPSSNSARCEPMNPAPPVMRAFFSRVGWSGLTVPSGTI